MKRHEIAFTIVSLRHFCRFFWLAPMAAPAWRRTAPSWMISSPGWHDAEDAGEAGRIEAEIWIEWSKSGSPAMDLLLQRGEDAMELGNFQRRGRAFHRPRRS